LKFDATPLAGACVVDLERIEDERGFFARSFCRDEFEAHGFDACVAQCNVSFNRKRGTLRGLHYQAEPYAEAKLVRCTRGAVCDVIVDIRAASPSRLQWYAVELTADNHRALYVPKGFAHGFQTLTDDTELFYQMSEPYHPGSARGLRWDDPLLAVRWPIAAAVVSPRDAAFPLLSGSDPS
jgi:dTDP-4-dehydrorhamnose 3,5-epimerase